MTIYKLTKEIHMTGTKRFKDFGTPNKVTDYEPLGFSLAGEDFECKPAIQGKVLLDFIADADSNDGGRAAEGMRRFFVSVMPEEESKRFYKLIEDSEYIFDMEELSGIAAWLVEEYSQRPKELSKPSANGRRRSGTTPTAVAS